MKVLQVNSFSCRLLAIGFGLTWAMGTQAAWSQGISQPPESTSPDLLNGRNSAAPFQPSLKAGGGVFADFQTLISLIQNTFEPDSWLATGGQGTLMAYPAGVVIDPAGHMKHFRTTASSDRQKILNPNSPGQPGWQQPSSMRTVSLKSLDRALVRARETGSRPARELLELAGLSHIAYVKIDATNNDILFMGPASEATHGFLLVDLVTIVALANAHTAPLGCTIEPSNEGIRVAQEWVTNRNSLKQLSRDPEQFVREMESRLGPHAVHVFGLPANCSTAVALVDTDEFMKRAGFGSLKTNPHVTSYFEFMEAQTEIPEQSLVRWWFCYGERPIVAYSNGELFQLPENCVAVLSEQQQVSRQAIRAPSGERDLAADKFANEFTRLLPKLRVTNPSCARLCAVFETCLAVQLALETTDQTDLKAWLPNLFAAGFEQTKLKSPQPQTVDGFAAWHRLESGAVVAVASGGVEVSPTILADRQQWQTGDSVAPAIVSGKTFNDSNAEGIWWGD